MRWSELKKRVRDNLADSVKNKVEFHSTTYRKPNSSLGRGWITIEGKEIVNFSSFDSGSTFGAFFNETTPKNKKRYATHEKVLSTNRKENQIVEKGEFSRFDLHICMFESLNMSIDKMLEHESPIVQSLAILDKRTGKRTLDKLKDKTLDRLPKYFLDYRLNQEK